MKVHATDLPEVKILEPKVFGDERGFFLESYSRRTFDELVGPSHEFVQDNHSRSSKDVLRAIHYQIEQPQGKLVRVVQGEILDVAVDLRRSSPNFGKWITAKLSSENHHQIWVPAGFGHGLLTLSETAEVCYKTTDFYAPEHERCIIWNDEDIGIDWQLTGTPQLSGRDAGGLRFKEAEVFA